MPLKKEKSRKVKNKKKDKPRASFKVGDKILDFGHVCRIFKVKNRKGPKGKRKKVIHFKNYFKTPQNKGATYSIPVECIKKTNIRKPISKEELKKLVGKLSKNPEAKSSISTAKAKNELNKNDAFKTVRVLKRLWLDKNDESTSFTKARKDLLDLAIRRSVEEVALVGNTSVSNAKKKIKESLRKLKKDEQDEA